MQQTSLQLNPPLKKEEEKNKPQNNITQLLSYFSLGHIKLSENVTDATCLVQWCATV